jgi:UDP-3-O-acyl N-acetylglucosamine deacetylase
MILTKLSHRYQRTIARSAEVRGVGFLTGADIRLRFHAAPADAGISFLRADVQPHTQIPARFTYVTSTNRRTSLGYPPHQVALVEHVMAALTGLRIDNCLVELDAPEPPGLDGSSKGFVEVLRRAGTVLQPGAPRVIWGVADPVIVSAGGASLAFHPGPENELKISYLLDYGLDSPIGKQSHTQLINPERFANDLADCRTFLLESEAIEMQRQGLGSRTTHSDLLVIGPHGPIDNHYRHGDELARHKILDIVGDLGLLGADLRGHVVAYRSGHPLNIELLRALTGSAGQALRLAA